MNKTHNVTAVLGEYKNAQGEIKKRYAKVGALFSRDDGSMAIKMDTVPVGDEWNGWLNLYPDEYKKEMAQPNSQPQTYQQDYQPITEPQTYKQGYQPSTEPQPSYQKNQRPGPKETTFSNTMINQDDEIPF